MSKTRIYELARTLGLESKDVLARAQELGLGADRIILSAKVSAVQDLVSVYQMLAERGNYALHLGLTEAGMGTKGVVASTAGLAILLQQGIGDTIRVSLTPAPGEARTREVEVAQQILQTMGLRSFAPVVTSCPGCGRTTRTVFQELAHDIQTHIAASMPEWRKLYPGVETLTVAVMVGVSSLRSSSSMGVMVMDWGVSQLALVKVRLEVTVAAPVSSLLRSNWTSELGSASRTTVMVESAAPPSVTAEVVELRVKPAESSSVTVTFSPTAIWITRAIGIWGWRWYAG